ncbi:AAA family ATPase [Wolbachia endosymbiont (group A) of Agelastica alni]|uniref:AAA family ATPase n=1 Tax=Wolbachia endosymbiont (group A) of Agelastica alni TaxID=3066130 RepID=UPI00333FA870
MSVSYNVPEIKAQLLLNLRSCLSYLFPNGTFHGNEFRVGNIHGNKGQSLRVALTGGKAGLWQDFATGQKGDVLDIWAGAQGKDTKRDFCEVMASISEWLGYGKKCTKADEDFEKFITHSWNYYDENGQVIVKVYRSDPPGKKKVYKPFDVKQSKFAAPEIRPLYNIPEILKSDKVILVEGEKCAEALIEQGIAATTTMSGANADVDKTDWSPLKGKNIIIWPDNDEAGNKYAKNAEKKLLEIGVASLVVLNIPQNKPKGWDAADCVLEGISASEFIERRLKKNAKLNILDWNLSRYLGAVPPQKFLVEGLFPLGVTSIVAAMGDTGKGMLLLDLALKVASDTDQVCGFGSLVKEHGSVVIFSAEDDADEIHRRLERLDPEGNRTKYQDRVFIVPMPNTGGPFSIIKTNMRGKCPETSEKFEDISEQLNAIENLKLIIFDPLVSFVHADINSDPELGWYSTGLLASLATETGATVIAAHHMRKPKCGSITTIEQARDAIRGTTALVDGVRCSFALWPAPVEHQNSVCNTLKLERTHSTIYQGAIVKSNGAADRSVRTYLRSPTGLLEDISEQINAIKSSDEELKNILIHYIKLSAQEGHPFTHTGGPGIFKQRHKLPPMFHNASRHKLERLVQSLLNENKVVKGMAADSKEDKWLDVPTGLFARTCHPKKNTSHGP